MLWQCGVERTAAVKSRRHRSDSDPQHQFSVDAALCAMKPDGVGSPERSPSSRDVVIACVVSSQKRGVDMTRGYYESANKMWCHEIREA